MAIRGRSACRRQKLFRASALSQRSCGVPAFAGRDFSKRGLDYAGVVGTAVLTIPSDEPGLSAQATAALPSVSGTGERPGAPARVPFTAWRGWTHDPRGLSTLPPSATTRSLHEAVMARKSLPTL